MLLLIVWLVVSTRDGFLFQPSDAAGVRTLRTILLIFPQHKVHVEIGKEKRVLDYLTGVQQRNNGAPISGVPDACSL
jgi:hypothetical protein